MKKSLTKWNKFFSSLFYAVLLALPMLSVLARVVYVQSNNNANQSYSGALYTNESIISSSNQLRLNNGDYTYFRLQNNYLTNDSTTYSVDLQFTNFELLESSLTFSNIPNSINIVAYTQNLVVTIGGVSFNSNNSFLLFRAVFTGISSDTNLNHILSRNRMLSVYTNNSYSFVDNVFDYSINQVINTYGKGNINFVNWFGNMFFDNPQNLLYLNFVNMYLNYTLLVSVAYLMYLFLSFFIQIIRELIFSFIDKTQKVGD